VNKLLVSNSSNLWRVVWQLDSTEALVNLVKVIQLSLKEKNLNRGSCKRYFLDRLFKMLSYVDLQKRINISVIMWILHLIKRVKYWYDPSICSENGLFFIEATTKVRLDSFYDCIRIIGLQLNSVWGMDLGFIYYGNNKRNVHWQIHSIDIDVLIFADDMNTHQRQNNILKIRVGFWIRRRMQKLFTRSTEFFIWAD